MNNNFFSLSSWLEHWGSPSYISGRDSASLYKNLYTVTLHAKRVMLNSQLYPRNLYLINTVEDIDVFITFVKKKHDLKYSFSNYKHWHLHSPINLTISSVSELLQYAPKVWFGHFHLPSLLWGLQVGIARRETVGGWRCGLAFIFILFEG